MSPRDISSYYTCCPRFFLKSGDSMARSRKKSHFPPYYRHFLAKRTLVQMFITQLLPTWIKAKILGCTVWCTQNGTVPDLPRVSLRFTLGYALLRFAFPFSRRPLVQRDKRKSWVKWQPAFRLVKVVFVVVNRQHRVHNQTVVPVVSVVVKTKAQKR